VRLTMADEARYYVALGDALSMDAYAGGPGRGAPALLYKNRSDDFPEWQSRDLSARLPGARLIPLAMDGATTATLRFAQVPRLRGMDVRASLATVTVGTSDLLAALSGEDTARAAHRALWEHGQAALGALRSELLLPGAPLIVATVPDPSDGTGGALSDWIGRCNETLRALAAEHGASVADLHARLSGHGLSAGDPTQQDPRPENRALWYSGAAGPVPVPNGWGASEVRAAFWDALAGTSGIVEAA